MAINKVLKWDTKDKGIKDLVATHDDRSKLVKLLNLREAGTSDEQAKSDEELRQNISDYYNDLANMTGGEQKHTPDKLTGEEIKTYLETMSKQTLPTYRRDIFNANIDGILSDESGLGKKGLEMLLEVEDVQKSIKREDIGVFAAYQQVQQIKDYVGRYESHGLAALEKDEAKRVLSYAVEGAIDAQRDALKKMGYTGRSLEITASMAGLAVQAGNFDEEKIKEYAMAGAKAELKEVEKAYQEVSKKAKESIYDVARNAIKNIASQGPESRDKAIDLVVGAYKATAEERGKTL